MAAMLDKISLVGLIISGLLFLSVKIAKTQEINIQTNNSRLSIDQNGNISIKTPNLPNTVVPNRLDRTENSSYQQTSIAVNSANFQQPHWLKITSIAKQLSGEISLNGRVIKKLTGDRTQIDLAPYLSKGQHRLEIALNYVPNNASIDISFSAPGTNVVQQTSGNGKLRHNLIITVR
jgi:hypothetical protein